MGKSKPVPYTPREASPWDTRFGSANCRCTRTGPENTYGENTYEVSESCGLHGPQKLDTSPGMEEVQASKDAAPGAAYDPPPDHYSTGAGIDPWQVWDAFGLDKDAYLANAVKYILRAGKKSIAPRLDDLVKARNYINKAIEKENARTP